ncbi:MAG: hypothetical protein Q4A74_03650 [Cardiobacteriaceae bacterium]|nr:hypothetical protein [Cardiobacteriaceae bacterium]
MRENIHNTIIKEVANAYLQPAGLVQKGQSCTWLDDCGCFSTIVEFQPFSGYNGSALNVGVNFHWYPETYFSFDIGYRQNLPCAVYEGDEAVFTAKIEDFCTHALYEVAKYRQQLRHSLDAKYAINQHSFTSEGIWGSYYKMVINGLTHDWQAMKDYFQVLQQQQYAGEWLPRLQQLARTLVDIDKHEDFVCAFIGLTQKSRQAKKLPAVSDEDLAQWVAINA